MFCFFILFVVCLGVFCGVGRGGHFVLLAPLGGECHLRPFESATDYIMTISVNAVGATSLNIRTVLYVLHFKRLARFFFIHDEM